MISTVNKREFYPRLPINSPTPPKGNSASKQCNQLKDENRPNLKPLTIAANSQVWLGLWGLGQGVAGGHLLAMLFDQLLDLATAASVTQATQKMGF